ncbi:hypothetical protein MY494_07600 [Synechococcus sp. A10-1-5-1]|uniref:hypothetical protein n=1 Tax=Synechococcus sp. A10-1-5-1 TaxID=2936507 RepID=UPI00200141D8|nr:hypothetical protein [Synechococcus sp. A10-1-5-1]UPM49217.1 hypothetical protein MY494_07600 [Synechococcus sp. A10-1-5-1]
MSSYYNVYCISSPQEALAVKRVSRDFQIDVCYAIKYQACTDGLYYDVIRSILNDQKVEFLELGLRNHRIEVNSCRLAKALKAVVWNLQSIRRVISHIEEEVAASARGPQPVIRLFAQKDSPIFDLMKYQGDYECINIDHCPSDAGSRELLGSQRMQDNGFKILSKFRHILLEDGITLESLLKVCRWSCRTVCRFLFVGAVRTVYTDFCKDSIAKCGYSWIPARAHSLLEYKDLQVFVELKDGGRLIANGSCILLVEHIAQYTNIHELHEELSKKDMVSIYTRMCKYHCFTNELILLKLHPAVEEFASKSSIRLYADSIISRLAEIGYNRVYLISDYIDDEVKSVYPIECLKKCLRVKKVVGIYSSVMVNMSCFEDVRIISDCREVSFFRDLRDRQSRLTNFTFEAY